MNWHAYIDESMRHRPNSTGLYVLAAAVFDPVHTERLRAHISELAQGKQRFHWHDESAARRRKAVATVAASDALHVVVVGTELDNRRQERGRRSCLARLLWELDVLGVSSAWLDSRRSKQNVRDLELVNAMRARHEISGGLRVDFITSAAEPLIWLPDIVAGAVSTAHGDGNHELLMMLEPVLTCHTIELH